MTDNRPIVSPPTARGLSRVEAARYIGVGATTFDKLVGENKMPKPKRIGARTIWDVRSLDLAFDELDSDDNADNEWDAI